MNAMSKTQKRFGTEIIMAIATSLIVTGLLLHFYEQSRNEQLYENQIAACERGNYTREAIHLSLTSVIKSPNVSDTVRDKFIEVDKRIWPVPVCENVIKKP